MIPAEELLQDVMMDNSAFSKELYGQPKRSASENDIMCTAKWLLPYSLSMVKASQYTYLQLQSISSLNP